jgi:hypothetical protein|tara:strand:+ start:818 stop:1084 length:267 start_codon:yes stop_codon:yes gene_type:complete
VVNLGVFTFSPLFSGVGQSLKPPCPFIFFNLNGGVMSMYRVVDRAGNETVVEVSEYNRGQVLEKACRQLYGNSTIELMIGHFRITPVK